MIEVRPASLSDAEDATVLFRLAARWLIEKGEPLWAEDEFNPAHTLAWIAAGELVVATSRAEIVGAMLFQLEDRRFWPDRAAGEAAYLHKLVRRRNGDGTGASAALVSWAGERAKKLGLGFLRLDCDPRPKLCAVYEGLGFRFVDAKTVPPFHVHRYELQV